MTTQIVEGGVDLSRQQDAGFSLGSITRRDDGTVIPLEQRGEADRVAGEIAAFAESRGLGFTATEVPTSDHDENPTTFSLGEKRVSGARRQTYELTVGISDTGTHLTSDGPVSRAVELRIGPDRSPQFLVTEKHVRGIGSYGFEATPAQLKAVLNSLRRGTPRREHGSLGNLRVPSWRSLAART